MSRIELCGIGFGGEHMPEGGLIYSNLDGFDGRPSARGGGDAIPGGSGDYGRTFEQRESRVVTVNAAILADSTAEYMAIKRRVENMPMFGELRVDQGDGVWMLGAEIDTVRIPDAYMGFETEFTIDLVAPDPVRYRDVVVAGPAGLPVQDGGLVLPEEFPWDFGTSIRPIATVVNSGAVPVLPRMVLGSSTPGGTASADAVTVRGGPNRLEFGPFDGTLVFDSLERRAWLNGVDVTRQVIRRDWPSVAPGVSADFFFVADDPSPDLVLTVEYRIGVW